MSRYEDDLFWGAQDQDYEPLVLKKSYSTVVKEGITPLKNNVSKKNKKIDIKKEEEKKKSDIVDNYKKQNR